MLAHSPPLPLIIYYSTFNRDLTSEDEEGMILALEQRDRVSHVRIHSPVQNLQKVAMVIDEEFPILEYLIMEPTVKDNTALTLPGTFEAPRLRHLLLINFALPMRSQFLTTAVGLVVLALTINHPPAYFQPNILLQCISLMPQLEMLTILFLFPVPNRDVERQLMRTPITAPITLTLPNFRHFWFRGASAYFEAIICRIPAAHIEGMQIQLFEQLTFSIPHLVQFINTTEIFRFDSVELDFSDKRVCLDLYPRETGVSAFVIKVYSWHLDWQVSSAAQISIALNQLYSAVEHLFLEHKLHGQSSEEHNEVNRSEWRKLLSSFSNVKTLRVGVRLVEELSRCLHFEDGELPLELLPELQKLTYFGSRNAFTAFIDARQAAGRPVTLVQHRASPFVSSLEAPTIISGSGKGSGKSESGNDLDA